MSEQIEVSGSKEKVALDMAKTIAQTELSVNPGIKRNFRQHFLTLYRQCHKATHNFNLKDILAED